MPSTIEAQPQNATATPTTTDLPDSAERTAYLQLQKEIDAVPEAELATINVDVPTAVTTALGVATDVAELADVAKKTLLDFDASCFTNLRSYALALSYAHTVYQASAASPDDLTPLVAQATDARERLLADVRALANHGLIDPSRVADMERGLGHRGVAFDVARLVEVLRENWKAVEGRTALTAAKVAEMSALASRLLEDVAHRDQGGAPRAEAIERRQKAFTIFLHAYTEVRAAVAFLRRAKGDVDQLVPSLYAGRGNSNLRRKDAGAPTPAPVVAPAQAASDAPHAPAIAPGLPGASPFQA